MDNFIINLNRISKEDTLSIATSLLYSLRGFPQYSITSELSYLLDYDSFIKLITYYGGMTIRIPSIDEINDIIKILLLYQYYTVEGIDWKDALEKSGFKQEESRSAQVKLTNLKKLLSEQEIGGRFYE
jgi:hypothetical protein